MFSLLFLGTTQGGARLESVNPIIYCAGGARLEAVNPIIYCAGGARLEAVLEGSVLQSSNRKRSMNTREIPSFR